METAGTGVPRLCTFRVSTIPIETFQIYADDINHKRTTSHVVFAHVICHNPFGNLHEREVHILAPP